MDTSKTYFGLPRPPKKTTIIIFLLLLLVPVFTIWSHHPDSFQVILNRYATASYGPSQACESSVVTTTNTTTDLSNFTEMESVTTQSAEKTVTIMEDSVTPMSRYPPPSRLINITDFQFLINPVICKPNEEIFMLVLVGSHPKNVLVREALRKTWGNPKINGYPFKLGFVFGKQKEYMMQKLLETESYERGDIIQGNFKDSYHNVTARDMMALRWAWSYCANANYIIRADDDISVDIFTLKDILIQKFSNYRPREDRFIACYAKFVNAPVLRSGVYAISEDEYPKNVFDPYCSGWLYVLNPKMAYDLDQAGLYVKPFWMNDAYITGTLISAIGAKLHDLNIRYTFDYNEMVLMDSQRLKIPMPYQLGYVGNNVTLLKSLHKKYKNVATMTTSTAVMDKFNNEISAYFSNYGKLI